MSETDAGKTATPGSTELPARPRPRPWASALPGLRDATRRPAISLRALLLVLVAGGIVAVGHLVEDIADSGPLEMLSPGASIPRWTIVGAVVYMVLIVIVMEREIRQLLGSLRPVVRVPDERYQADAQRMGPPGRTVELVLLGTSTLLVTLLFVVLGSDLHITNDRVGHQSMYLPAAPAAAVVILAGYAVFGWAGLSLVFTTIRSARALGRLSREPVAVNVFDTTDLLPFGRMALVVSLAPAGLIAIFLFGLGQPSSSLGWAVLLLASFASVLALVLPLRGIHHQMSGAKQEAFTGLSAQLAAVHDGWTASDAMPAADVGSLANRTAGLIALRRTVIEMRTWPFQGPIAFGRAVLFAAAPLIYAALSELIKVWITPLVH